MAEDKTEEQQRVELEATEIPGTLNPWEAKQDRYTNSILGESAGTDFSQQTLSNLIRRDKNRLEGVQNRVCLVVAEESPSSYEAIRFNMNRPKGNEPGLDNLKKVYTRNAESKTYFVTPTWEYGESPFDEYRRGVMNGMHTYSLIDTGEGNLNDIKPGSYVEQIYEDDTQDASTILKKHKQGMQNFPRVSNAKITFVSKAGSIYVTTVDEGKTLKPPGTTTLVEGAADELPKGSLVKLVLNEPNDPYWSPVYNPCAIKAGSGKIPRVSIGSLRTEAPEITKKDGTQGGKPGEGSDFGPRYHPTLKEPIFHEGIDMGVMSTYPIVAVAGGTISRIKMNGASSPLGNDQPTTVDICYVSIRHTLPEELTKKKIEIHTTYMHLLKVANSPTNNEKRLQIGDEVKAGQAIGFMGGGKNWPGSGRTTGPHLHFELGIRQLEGDQYVYDEYKVGSVSMKKKGGSMGYGAVDPIHFDYPNIKEFSKEAEELLAAFKPTNPQIQKNEKEAENQATNTTTTAPAGTASEASSPPSQPPGFVEGVS